MSLGSNTNTYISDLINAGADAMTNLYYLEFSGSLLDNDENLKIGLKVRTKDFNPPEFSQDQKNTVNYISTTLDWPLSVVSGDKSFSLNIRLDKDYRVYQYLLRQKAVTSNTNLGFASGNVPDSNHGGFKVDVYSFDASKNGDTESAFDPEDTKSYRKLYTFEYCWIKKIHPLQFAYDNPKAMEVKADIGFFKFDDPMNLLAKE